MKFWWRSPNTHTSALLRITVAWAQCSAGTGTLIFTDTITALPHLESSWPSSARNHLKDVKSSLELDNTGVPPSQRLCDSCTVDQALASEKFQPNQIRKINCCRLCLRVVTVGDVATAGGTQVLCWSSLSMTL